MHSVGFVVIVTPSLPKACTVAAQLGPHTLAAVTYPDDILVQSDLGSQKLDDSTSAGEV